ncbi:hypothetical protein [[Haemophilus] ducreyi]|uniref:hypothetical protein n=1 Tax=Haemophilus ducreyi TaxID=730 RepID=UPI00065588BF|nr:hypothetical protein [[Haemophilus] ducreyi]AKO45705.1 hypothetical protein RZ66_05640 [[Haemophilus] ducreyi]AKO47091.1 hypothetical protein RZ67_05565 [[Haemophilus] ducreyi]AKO48436.1 hypothetical protein RZ68_05550 [[Haemophilus] ducreyi]AKO49821.1 hypothetical protein RZ69_05575 [[Haemophilus] ducreyi]OOS03034.1 hypothetical protein B0190_05905 [[Haemophilus] ducreyi]
MSNEHIFSDEAVAEMQKVQNATALSAKAMTQNLAEAYETMGMLKAFSFVEKLATVSNLKILAELKETKKYKGLSYVNQDGKLETVSTWEQFCTACGLGKRKIDEDLANLSTFGEEFLETSQKLGLGYREMKKLRKLPEEARAEIVEVDYSEATDKEDLIEKIEELSVKHAKEKESLTKQLESAKANYDAQAKVIANKDERLNKLDKELAKKTLLIETQTPDQRGGMLREEAAQISYKAEAILRGQVYQAFEALQDHQDAHGIDHRQFMSGVLAEYQLILSELKERFNLTDEPIGDNLPEWARNEYADEPTVEPSLAAILDEVSEAEIVE